MTTIPKCHIVWEKTAIWDMQVAYQQVFDIYKQNMNAIYYKNAYDTIFKSLPRWKQVAIKDDSKRNNWSGILTDFVKLVIETAEREFDNVKVVQKVVEKETVPEKTKTKKKSKSKTKKS